MTITKFLEARIAEDEAVATNVLVFRMIPGRTLPGNQAIPARVRAECAAKRAIMAVHENANAEWQNDLRIPPVCNTCVIDHNASPWPCATLRALAAIYASHPGYRQEWAL